MSSIPRLVNPEALGFEGTGLEAAFSPGQGQEFPLKVCPCCGSTAELIEVEDAWETRAVIQCQGCGLQTPAYSYYNREQIPKELRRHKALQRSYVLGVLEEIWNRRVNSAPTL